MVHGTHNALDDPRNEEILVYINGELLPRQDAKISVFDSGYLVGDGVWEGLRLHHGVLVFLDPRLNCHSKLHEVQALIQALQAGADEALMLDIHGFVECRPYYDQLLELAIH